MKQATYFIEVVKVDGIIKTLPKTSIHHLQWSLSVNNKHGFQTIAIFKIYPKGKLAIAHYDEQVGAVIIQ